MISMTSKTFGPLAAALALLCGVSASAQTQASGTVRTQTGPATTTATVSAGVAVTNNAAPVKITASTPAVDLARAAFAAEGGEKFLNVKSTVLSGSVELYAPNSSFSLPGQFVSITAGERSRRDVKAQPPAPPLIRMIYDGRRAYSSIPGFAPPPVHKVGMYMLARFDQPGYTVSALPDKKKLRGFRIADAEGNATDFYIEPETNRVTRFSFVFDQFTFSTERKKLTAVEGVLVPYNFTEGLETPSGTFYIEYKVKDAKINQPLADDVFAIPAQ